MDHRRPSLTKPIARRRFLTGAAAWTLPPLLLNCRQGPATAAAGERDLRALYVADFREPGLSDRQVLDRAFAAWVPRGRVLHLEPGRVYDLGSHRGPRNVFALHGVQNGVIAGNGATLRIHNDGPQAFNLFYLAHYSNLRIENLHCVDTGWRAKSGAKFIVLDAGNRESLNLSLDNVSGERLVSFIHIQGRSGGPRVRGVRIAPNCRATRVYYGLTCLDNGDDISGGFSTYHCRRSYFPYGVTNHDLVIKVHHGGWSMGPAAETPILIKSYGRTTSRIRLDVSFYGILAWAYDLNGNIHPGSCVTLEHQHAEEAGVSVIEDIDLRINVARGTTDPYACHRLVMRSYGPDPNPIEQTRTRNIWRRIRLSGELRPGRAPAIFSRALPASSADITIVAGTTGADPDDIRAPGFLFRRV